MSETRVQFNTIVSNQLPTYVQEDYPLISQFLKQYYLGQEYQGGPVDLIQNIDKYVKLDNTTNLNESVVLNGDLEFDAETINVDPGKSPSGTNGFPDSYGLLQIDDEIITYTGKTTFSFTGCIRGFVGITSYRSELNKEEVVFEETESDDHNDNSIIKNLKSKSDLIFAGALLGILIASQKLLIFGLVMSRGFSFESTTSLKKRSKISFVSLLFTFLLPKEKCSSLKFT